MALGHRRGVNHTLPPLTRAARPSSVLSHSARRVVGSPALGLGGEPQFGGELAHRGELEPAQPGGQVGRQARRFRQIAAAPR
jgi:hypothetical protein